MPIYATPRSGVSFHPRQHEQDLRRHDNKRQITRDHWLCWYLVLVMVLLLLLLRTTTTTMTTTTTTTTTTTMLLTVAGGGGLCERACACACVRRRRLSAACNPSLGANSPCSSLQTRTTSPRARTATASTYRRRHHGSTEGLQGWCRRGMSSLGSARSTSVLVI